MNLGYCFRGLATEKKVDEMAMAAMNEMRNISVTVIPMLKAKAYCPTKFPEMETKYNMLGEKY